MGANQDNSYYQETVFIQRRQAAKLKQYNEVLDKNEFAFEEDTNIMKIGDGVTPYNDLPIFPIALQKGYFDLKSPDGTVWRLSVDNTGNLVRTAQ